MLTAVSKSLQRVLWPGTPIDMKLNINIGIVPISGVARNFFRGRGSTNSVEDRGERERGSGDGSPLVRGSGGSCNLVQEI